MYRVEMEYGFILYSVSWALLPLGASGWQWKRHQVGGHVRMIRWQSYRHLKIKIVLNI